MRPRIIVLLSVLGGIGAAAAVLQPELRSMSGGGGWRTIALAAAPKLALAFLFCCASLVVLLSTAVEILDLRRVRSRLRRLAAPTRAELLASFAASGLEFLAYRLFDLAPADASTAGSDIVVQSRFDRRHARQEVFCHYRKMLMRCQFGTLLVLLLLVLAFFVLNEYLRADISGVFLPSGSALAAVGGVVMLVALCWFVLGLAAESLLDAVAALPVVRLEMRLFRLLMAALDVGQGVGSDAAQRVAAEAFLRDIALRLERSHDVLHDAVVSVSASVQQLTAATAAVIDLERDIDPAEAGLAHQLKTAIAGLAEKIARMDETLATGAGQQQAAGTSPRREHGGDIGRQLRQLMAEFEGLPDQGAARARASPDSAIEQPPKGD